MARPTKCRHIAGMPANREFYPKIATQASITLSMEELEVLRRVDGNGEDQEETARLMMVSRGTVQRLLQDAHQKIAEALVEGKQIRLAGGNFEVTPSPSGEESLRFTFKNHGEVFTMSQVVAVIAQDDQVSQHFGRSQGFVRFDVVDGEIKEERYVDSSAHQHDGLPTLLKAQGVNTVIAGGIGGHAVERLESQGLTLLAGVTGTVKDAILRFLQGSLESGDPSCSAPHEHGGHEHGGHGHGGHGEHGHHHHRQH